MNKNLIGNKKRPFEVPDNYFEDFESRFMKQLQKESLAAKSDNFTIAPIISVVKPWLAMAGGFLLIAILYFQVPRFFGEDIQLVNAAGNEEALINSLAYIFDENDINELILGQDSAIVLPPDTFFVGTFTEEELAALTYFE